MTLPELSLIEVSAPPDPEVLAGDRDAVRALLEHAAGRHLDLEDGWPALHFALSGEVPIPKEEALKRGISWNDNSLENVLMGGIPTALVATGGPARYHPPAEVRELARTLSRVDPDAVAGGVTPEDLEGESIPLPASIEPEELGQWLRGMVQAIQSFFRAVADAGRGILTVFD
jgi:hypothetical protein